MVSNLRGSFKLMKSKQIRSFDESEVMTLIDFQKLRLQINGGFLKEKRYR